MGFTCFQQPHPPLEMGAQSDGATRRAARITDGVFFGPQVAWRDIEKLAAVFRDERAKQAGVGPGHVGASRSLIVGKDRESRPHRRHEYLEKTFAMYRRWEMQEKGMVPLQLSPEIAAGRLDGVRLAARLRGDAAAGGARWGWSGWASRSTVCRARCRRGSTTCR